MSQNSLTEKVSYKEIPQGGFLQILQSLLLFKRYAGFIVKDKSVAEKLVKQVLEDQYEINELEPSEKLRQVLKNDLLNRCYFYKHFLALDRPPIKVPLRKCINSPSKIIKLLTGL